MNTENNHFRQLRHSVPKKILASLVVLAFFFSQTIPSGFADVALQSETRATPYQSETNATDDSPNSQQKNETPDVPIDPSAAFLQNELSLTPSSTVSNNQQTSVQNARDAEEYSFEDAVDSLTSDYAAAVVVENMTADDLRQLVQKNVEVGIVVIRGKIVMFTTGSRDELRANPVVRSLLAESSILIHTHPEGTQTQPSALDINLAGTATEYVLTTDGVCAYNSSGIVSSDLSEEDLLALIETNHVRETSSVEARAILNGFIAEIDNYNTDPSQYTILRSAEPITVLPGKPALGTWSYDGHSDPVVTQLSASEFEAQYDVTASGSYSGVTVNFAVNGQTSQDLSSLGYFSFDAKTTVPCSASGTQRCVKIEFKDTSNRIGAFKLVTLSTSYTHTEVTMAFIQSLNTSMDLTHIKEINFIFENTYDPVKAATVGIKLGGFLYSPVINTNSTAALSNLNGASVAEMEPCSVDENPCQASHLVHTVTSFVQNGTTGFTLGYDLSQGTGNNRWGAGMISFDDAALFNVQNSDLVLQVDGTGASYYK
ncbi:MAG: hypothetical protein WC484_06630, partial [Candidatus Omnitrophota bacterium]